jgi:hypothetical protein
MVERNGLAAADPAVVTAADVVIYLNALWQTSTRARSHA